MSDTANTTDRASKLEERRLGKMAESAHAFVRGNTVQHYEWISELPPLPEGPAIWICGDCHVGNLGPIADKGGAVEIQIRDLDQTTIGNPAHDLVRLALSLSSAARSSDLPGATTARIVEALTDGYEAGLHSLSEEPTKEPNSVASVRREALGRKWHHLAIERLGGVRPAIPLGKKFWELSDEEKWSIGTLLDSPNVKKLILDLNKRSECANVKLIDAAYWMKGCSSLGKLRYAALVHLTGERKDKLSLVDIKEAGPAAAPSAPGADIPPDHAERVVAGARALSPKLGERMASSTIAGRPVVIRELMPEDLKLEMEQFSRKEAVTAARYLATVIGKAHGRQMSPDDRTRWARDVKGQHRSGSSAPPWLWTTVVSLLTRHEGAYLEHCRLQWAAAA
jgi:uncharacterized protein (DUF2252 family)